MNNKPEFIVVEGSVGVGKTTLAKRLAESFNTDLLLEDADENSFLNRFYENQKNVAFETQPFFISTCTTNTRFTTSRHVSSGTCCRFYYGKGQAIC